MLEDKELLEIINGEEWNNHRKNEKSTWPIQDKLIKAIKLSGTTIVIVSKTDVLDQVKKFKLIYNHGMTAFENISEIKVFIKKK